MIIFPLSPFQDELLGRAGDPVLGQHVDELDSQVLLQWRESKTVRDAAGVVSMDINESVDTNMSLHRLRCIQTEAYFRHVLQARIDQLIKLVCPTREGSSCLLLSLTLIVF